MTHRGNVVGTELSGQAPQAGGWVAERVAHDRRRAVGERDRDFRADLLGIDCRDPRKFGVEIRERRVRRRCDEIGHVPLRWDEAAQQREVEAAQPRQRVAQPRQLHCVGGGIGEHAQARHRLVQRRAGEAGVGEIFGADVDAQHGLALAQIFACPRWWPDSCPVRRYLMLARAPHGPRMLAGAAVFYPGQAALGLVLLLSLHRATGSFASAGAAGGAETIAFSLSSIVQGRWLDRQGPRVLVPVAVACVLAIAAIDVALVAGAGTSVLVGLSAAVGGSIPAAGASLRTLWSSLLDDPDQRATAFAYQSLAQDAGFVIGPAALGALTTAVSPTLGLSSCAALIAAGAVTVAIVPSPARATRPPAGASERSIVVALGALAATLAAVGVTLGAVDVSTAAFATDHHSQQLAGVMLAAFSVGSVAGGVAYGARSWRSGLHIRLLACTLALAMLTLAPVAAPSTALLAPALVLAGAPLAATLTTAYLLAAERAPAGRQTEAYALLSLTLNGGSALGSALGGQLVAGGSAGPGFLLGVASPLLGATIILLPAGLRAIRALR